MSSTNSNSAQTSESKTRSSMACLHCRGRKLKCAKENGQTRCTNCIKNKIQCIVAPVNNEGETKFTQSNHGPYTTQQFRVDHQTAYTNQHSAQPNQPSTHSWSIQGGNAVTAPPPPPHRVPPAQRAPAYQGAPSIQPQYPSFDNTYPPPGQYDPHALQQSQQQHGQQAAQMYRFVDDSYPNTWVPGPSNYPNPGTGFPAQYGDPQQGMSGPASASSSMHPQYGQADPNMPWNVYYPEQNNNDDEPFNGQGPY